MRRNKFPPNRFGAVEKRSQPFSLGAGEKGVLRPLTPRSKDVAARTRARGAQPCFAAKRCRNCVWVCLPTSRQQPFTGYPAANRNACGIHGGRNPLPAKRTAGILRFAAKPGFFPQKALFPVFVLAASELARRQFRRRGLGCAKIPGWPASGLFCPIAARSLWDILSMPYLAEIGRPEPGMRMPLASA